MSLYRKATHRRTAFHLLTITLATLGLLSATVNVRSQSQTSATPAPQVRRSTTTTTRPVQQPTSPWQRNGTSSRSVPATGNSTQMRNLVDMLRSRSTNATATSASQLRTPSSSLTRTTRSASGTNAGVSGNSTRPLRLSNISKPYSRSAVGTSSMSHLFAGRPLPPGSHETRTASGTIVRRAADGSVLAVANPRNGMLIQHGVDGGRRILVSQPDRTRIFATSRGVQYVQHPYTFRGRAYDHRTYYFQGKTVQRYYRPYTYGGATLDAYAPTRFYAPNLYRWAVSSFRPTPFQWTYTNQPWYQHYSGYFTPDSSYSSPSSWLADFVIGASLLTAYNAEQQSQQAQAPADGSSAITPQTKQLVAQEVNRQVREEAVEAQQNAQNVTAPAGSNGVVAELSDRQAHAFVVGSDLDLVDASGRRCMVSEGDVVAVVSPAKADTSTADAIVLASKGGEECQRSVRVQVALDDVQEMQNHMREAVDQGLASTNAAKTVPSVTPAFAEAGPPADPNAAQEIQQQQEIAAAAEG
jgi:hypothetical protein